MKLVLTLELLAMLTAAACGGHGHTSQPCMPDPSGMTNCYSQVPSPK